MEDRTPKDFDPPPAKRLYVRNADSKEVGWLVRRNGKDMVKLDRPQQDIIRPYEPSTWIQCVQPSRVNFVQVVRVAFEADRALRSFLGEDRDKKKGWLDLTEQQRKMWIEDGPRKPVIRRVLYRTIIDTLIEHMGTQRG